MSSVHRLFLLTWGCVLALSTACAAPPELAKLRSIYDEQMRKISAAYADAVSGFPKQYEQQLAQLERQLQTSGDLNGMLAIRREQQRFKAALSGEADPFELAPEMPPSARVEEPAQLRAAQELYIKRHETEATTKQERIDRLTKTYLQRLTELQRELTVKNRIRDALEVKQEVDRIETGDATGLPPADTGLYETPPVPADDVEIPTFGTVPAWARWEYEGIVNYTQEGSLFGHPDLPDELHGTFQRRQGRGRVYGTCRTDRRVVNMRTRTWFGKAALWSVTDLEDLNTLLVLDSKFLARGEAFGPSADLVIYNNNVPLKALTVSLGFRTVTLKLQYNAPTRQCALSWVEGNTQKLVDIPEGATLFVALGLTVRNPGEECDTAFSFQ